MMKRIKGINGFKGLAAFIIIFYHFWANKSGDFQRGYLAVDFFFVTSGFLLTQTCLSNRYPSGSVFLEHMIKKCMPASTVILCCTFMYQAVHQDWSVSLVYREFPHLLHEILYMYIFGVSPEYYLLSVLWYIPVWMFVSVMFYQGYKYNKEFFVKIALPLLVIGSYSYIFSVWGNLADFRSIDRAGYFIKGIYRGVAGMGTGFLLYHLMPMLKYRIMRIREFVFIFMEMIVALLVTLLIFSDTGYISDLLAVPCSCFIVAMCYMERGIFYRFMDLPIFAYFSGGGLYVYMTQGFAMSITPTLSRWMFGINSYDRFSFKVSLILLLSAISIAVIFQYIVIPFISKSICFLILQNGNLEKCGKENNREHDIL